MSVKDEISFQKEIIDSAKSIGGYGFKLSNRFTVGVPDLLISITMYTPSLLECKHLGAVVDDFDRQTGMTPLQREQMRRWNATQPFAIAAQLVFLKHHGSERAVLIPAHIDRIAHHYERLDQWVARNRTEPRWDVEALLRILRRDPMFKSPV